MSTEFPFVIGVGRTASVYSAGDEPAIELDRNVAFLLNVSRFVDQPMNGKIALAPGHALRKATAQELAAIQHIIKKVSGEMHWTPWQCDAIPKPDGGQTFELLPEDQWRYFVIEFSGNNGTVSELERALTICSREIRIGLTVLKIKVGAEILPAFIYDPGSLFQHLRALKRGSLGFVEIAESDVQQIRSLHQQLKAFKHDSVNLESLIQQAMDLEALPRQSPLLFLGYFALLESMLTHQPRKTDTIDSITRQIIKKISLLDNRWQPRLIYGEFPGGKPERIWSAMYSYRSCLAHGRKPDFANELQLLRNAENALGLLKQTVRGVLRQTLVEPQLMVDLRNC